MNNHTPTIEEMRVQYGDNAMSASGVSDDLAEFDRAIAKVRTDAKAEVLNEFARELNERNNRVRTAPTMSAYQRGRADGYESAFVMAEVKALAIQKAG